MNNSFASEIVNIDWNELDRLASENEPIEELVPHNLVRPYLREAVKRRLLHLTHAIIEYHPSIPEDRFTNAMIIAGDEEEDANFMNFAVNHYDRIQQFDSGDCPYRITGYLGSGTYGSVYQVQGIGGTLKNLAIKVIEEPDRISIVEIDLLTRLRHPAVMHREAGLLTGVCGLENGIAFALPLASGNLDGVELSMKEILKYFHQALQGLKFLHDNNILHLDISPRNILLVNGNAMLADFGLSRQTTQGTYVSDDARYAPAFRPPEEEKNNVYRKASDIWALGATMLYVETGMMIAPDKRHNVQDYIDFADETLEPILSRMLRIRHSERATVDELLAMDVFSNRDEFPIMNGYIVAPPLRPLLTPEQENIYSDFAVRVRNSRRLTPWEKDLTLDVLFRLMPLTGQGGRTGTDVLNTTLFIARSYYSNMGDGPEDIAHYIQYLDGYIYRGYTENLI